MKKKPLSREEFDKELKRIYKEQTGKELKDGIEIINGKPVEVWNGIAIKDKK